MQEELPDGSIMFTFTEDAPAEPEPEPEAAAQQDTNSGATCRARGVLFCHWAPPAAALSAQSDSSDQDRAGALCQSL